MNCLSRRLRYAIAFAIISIATEVALLIGGLEIPGDTLIIALIVLALAPPAAAWLTGLREFRTLARLWPITVLFTIAGSVAVGTVTGLLAPLLIRPVAGYLAALVTERIQPSPRR